MVQGHVRDASIQNLDDADDTIGLPADGPEPTIVNVCNGTEDCIVTPGNGFLTIEQVVPTGHGTGTFAFNLASGTAQNGAAGWSITPALVNGGAFGSVAFISMAPGTYTLNDVVPAGWELTTAGCRTDGQSTFAEGLPVAGPSTATVERVVINPGQVTRCKFGASRLAPASTTP